MFFEQRVAENEWIKGSDTLKIKGRISKNEIEMLLCFFQEPERIAVDCFNVKLQIRNGLPDEAEMKKILLNTGDVDASPACKLETDIPGA